MPEIFLNQAIATVPAAWTPDGLFIEGRLVKITLKSAFNQWRRRNMLPLTYTSTFRIWPRTGKDGRIKSAKVLEVAPPSDRESIFAGQVVYADKTKIVLKTRPSRDGVAPFLSTLFHDGSYRPQPGWAMQFQCEFREGVFWVVTGRSLKDKLRRALDKRYGNSIQEALPNGFRSNSANEIRATRETAAVSKGDKIQVRA